MRWYIALQVMPKLDYTVSYSTSNYANCITLPIFMSKIVICTLCKAAFRVPISADPKTSIDMSARILSNGSQDVNLRILEPQTLCNVL